MIQTKEFKVNDFITLKLERGKTNIYINQEFFRQCKYLLLNIPVDEIDSNHVRSIKSIDDAARKLDHTLETEFLKTKKEERLIPPDVEFWGHCSNLQAWVEHDYDPRLLHSNLTFPLLKALTEAGNMKARMVFLEEILNRIWSDPYHTKTKTINGKEEVLIHIPHMIRENYLFYLNNDEFSAFVEDIDDDYKKMLKNAFLTELVSVNRENYFFEMDYKEFITKTIQKQKCLDFLRILDNNSTKNLEYVNFKGELFFVKEDKLEILPNRFRGDPKPPIRRLKELQGLEKLVNLKELHLGEHRIELIECLENLVNLEVLNLDYNRITEIKGLDNLASLKELYLNYNRITEIKGLDNLANLKELYLNYNKISEMKNLDKLHNLVRLYLGENKISEIKNLDKLHNLVRLYLGENKISEIKNLDKLVNLEVLGLGANSFSEIPNLKNLKNFEKLSLGLNGNNIDHIIEQACKECGKEVQRILIFKKEDLMKSDSLKNLRLLKSFTFISDNFPVGKGIMTKFITERAWQKPNGFMK